MNVICKLKLAARNKQKMGRSAKLHKRVKKTSSSTSQAVKPTPAPPPPPSAPTNPNSKRRATLKDKAKRISSGGSQTGLGNEKKKKSESHVLGGADYVELMMGSRKRARAEAAKLSST